MIALHTYMANRPHDDTALHLCALLAEQLGYTTLMARKMERAFTLVEGKFSETESAQHTLRFGIINMNLGRMRLASLDAQGAMDHLELALALLEDLGDAPPMPSVRVWCHIGVACAQCLMGDYEEGMAGLRLLPSPLLCPSCLTTKCRGSTAALACCSRASAGTLACLSLISLRTWIRPCPWHPMTRFLLRLVRPSKPCMAA